MNLLRMPEFPWGEKNLLALKWTRATLTALFVKGAGQVRWKSFSTRETSVETVRRNLETWLAGDKVSQILAIMPRSEILQKEFSVARGSQQDIRQELDSRMQSLLPFSVKEMAWGLRMEPEDGKMQGLLIAAPGPKVKDAIASFKELGLDTDLLDLVSEDQTVFWAVLDSGLKEPVLVMEKDEGRVLAVLVKNGRLVFSMSFEIGPGETGALEWLPEISLRLLEAEVKPLKVLISGSWSDASRIDLARHFSVPAEFLLPLKGWPGLQGAVPSLYGALFAEEYPRISLLTREEKTAKRLRDRQVSFKQILLWAGVLTGLFTVLFLGRIQIVALASALTSHKVHAIAGPADEAGKVLSALKMVNQAQATKEDVLLFLRELAEHAPKGVRLADLRVENNKVTFSGTTTSYDAVSEMVEVLEKTTPVREVKLQSTRLRKNRGEDLLEFEVTGQWI